MKASTAKGLVIGSTATAGMLASASDLVNGRPPQVRTAVGAVIAAALLYALADVAPPLAGGLALVLLLGAVLTNGAEVAEIITKATN